MLKQRLITAFTLGPLLLWAFIALPDAYFAGLLAVIVLLGAKEWVTMARLSNSMLLPYLVVSALLIYACWWLIQNNTDAISFVLYIACAWWLTGFVVLAVYNSGKEQVLYNPFLRAVLGFVLLLPTFSALFILRSQYGISMLFFLLFLIWFADSGAYFAGKRFGKNKLLPHVSPGKTWEGVIGGVVASVTFSMIFAFYNNAISNDEYLMFVISAFVTVIFSIEGDLMESMFKRQVGIKDSSHILPGHGGVLDRIDSLTSASPIFVVCLMVLGIR